MAIFWKAIHKWAADLLTHLFVCLPAWPNSLLVNKIWAFFNSVASLCISVAKRFEPFGQELTVAMSTEEVPRRLDRVHPPWKPSPAFCSWKSASQRPWRCAPSNLRWLSIQPHGDGFKSSLWAQALAGPAFRYYVDFETEGLKGNRHQKGALSSSLPCVPWTQENGTQAQNFHD